jgi:hypothetical protein
MLDDLLLRHIGKGQGLQLTTAVGLYGLDKAFLRHRRDTMGHLYKQETMWIVLLFQCVGVVLWLRFLYLLDEES